MTAPLRFPARAWTLAACSLPSLVFLVCAAVLGSPPARAAEGEGGGTLRFNRDIKPLLAENCLACHGPDPGSRKANLRLDTKGGLFEATEKRGAAVVPGSLERSELWRRVIAGDEDEVMPPPKANKHLKPEQKELLRRWILAGAPWEGHWAFTKPERPAVPQVSGPGAGWIRNPVDAFVLAGLEARGLAPAPEADRRVLVRRLCLDLTGLPPDEAMVERFLNDRSPRAYERLVRRLMDSPQWGEHRARYWLDASRYADTHGLHFDNYREMWPYRDYVVRAFNRNLPFDQFVVEQLAGDLLESPTDEQLVATGFQRCNMTTNEGGTIEEENLANYANDRVTTFGWVFLGLTTNCGACHDHKFDPFTTRDFYSLAAFFRNTDQGGFDRNWREGDLYMVVPQTDHDRTRWKALPEEIDAARKVRDALQPEVDTAFTNWVRSVKPDRLARDIRVESEYLRIPLDEGGGTPVSARLQGRPRRFLFPTEGRWRGGVVGPAPVLDGGPGMELGDLGDFDAGESFSFGAWVHVPADYKGEGSVLARMAGEDGHHRGWDLFVKDDHFGIHLIDRWPSISLKVRSRDQSVKRGEWHHLFASYDGSTRGDGVRLFIDGIEVAVNRDQDRLEGSIRNRLPLRVGRREKGNELKGAAVQDIRIYRRRLDPAEIAALAVGPRVAQVLAAVDVATTNNPAHEAMRSYYRMTQRADWRRATEQVNRLESEREAIRGRSPVAHIQREKKRSEPAAHVLFRGQYDKPKDKVGAATPAALHPFPADAPRNRLGLARWVVSPENPLTARVTVNRFWQELFGTGLVKTAEDFGITGEAPVHPELLDWLAVEFQESGWDVKHLFTMLVTSAAYRQAAVTTPDKLEKDPQNRFLSRGPRFRMDAEMVRDYALAASGLLVPRLGGPSVKPPQPEGVWEAVAMPESNTRHYTPDEGDSLHRRSLYTFWKRAAPPATMDIFNAPSRETCVVRRERTNTPLQALATLNDPQFIEAARTLAEKAYLRSRGRPGKAVEIMAASLLARPLSAPELAVVRQTLAEATDYYRSEPGEAGRLGGGTGAAARGPALPPELAALTLVANQLMNLDETLNK